MLLVNTMFIEEKEWLLHFLTRLWMHRSQWKAWSSRSVSVALKCGDDVRLHVIFCYASTRTASIEEKTKFYDEISTILDEISISNTRGF